MEEVMNTLRRLVNPDILVENVYVFSVLSIFLAMYGPHLHERLPPSLFALFDNAVFRMSVLFLIVYMSQRDFIGALTITIIFMVTLNMLHTHNVVKTVSNTLDSTQKAAVNILNKSSTGLQNVAKGTVGVVGNTVKNTSGLVNSTVDDVSELVTDTVGGVSGLVSDAVANVSEWVADTTEGTTELVSDEVNHLSGTIDGAAELVGSSVGSAANVIGNTVGDVANVVGNTVGGVANVVGNTVGGVANVVTETAGDVVDVVTGTVGDVTDLIGNTIKDVGGVVNSAVGNEHFAQGLPMASCEGAAGNLGPADHGVSQQEEGMLQASNKKDKLYVERAGLSWMNRFNKNRDWNEIAINLLNVKFNNIKIIKWNMIIIYIYNWFIFIIKWRYMH